MLPLRIPRRTAPVAFLLGVLALLLALPGAAPARAEVINSSFFKGIAIHGYDPVAYFKEGRPVEGSAEHEHDWMGATWRFATAENLAAFRADPEAYAPQYGGYCAYGVAQGYTVDIDPEAWRVENGKLYLNYDKDIQAQWLQDIPGFIAKADANWPELKAGL